MLPKSKHMIEEAETLQLVRRSQAGDERAVTELVECNYDFLTKIISEYLSKHPRTAEYLNRLPHFDRNDLEAAALEGMINAIYSYNFSHASEAKFHTFAFRCISNRIKTVLITLRTKKTVTTTSLDHAFGDTRNACKKSNPHSFISDHSLSMSDYVDIACDYEKLYQVVATLTGLERKVLELKYGITSWEDIANIDIFSDSFGSRHKTMTDHEIAERLGFTTARASFIHKTALSKLRKAFYLDGVSVAKK